MSNKIGRITKLARETKDAKFYEVETLTTDLMTVTDTLTCAAVGTNPAIGGFVVLVEIQGKLFITGGAGVDKNILGQVTSVADDGQMVVALYEDGSTTALTETTHERKAATESVTAFQEAYGAADLKVNDWVKCYQLKDVWYVNNLDWTTSASEDLGAGQEVDFIVDNFDRADSNDLGQYWGSAAGAFQLLNNKATALHDAVYYLDLGHTASGTNSEDQDESEVVPFFHNASAALPTAAVGYAHPLRPAGALHIRVSVLAPSTGNKALGFGLSYNGAVSNGQLIAEEVHMIGANMPAFELVGVGGEVTTTSEHLWQVQYSLFAHSCSATSHVWTPGAVQTVEGANYGSATATTGGLSYSFAGGVYLGFRTNNAAIQSQVEVVDTAVGVATDSLSDTVLVEQEQVAMAASGLDTINTVDTTNISRTAFGANASYDCSGNIVLAPTSLTAYTDVATTAVSAASYSSAAPRLLGKHSVQVESLAVHLVATASETKVYVDGVLRHTTASVAINPFGLVGLVAIVNNVAEIATGENNVGLTQFKAWVGDVEPDGSESGHGDISALGAPTYLDGYHSTDAEGVVTYDPLAFD